MVGKLKDQYNISSQDGSDEAEATCERCDGGLTRCGDGVGGSGRCILDRQICDGTEDCPLGDDEVGLLTSDGVHLECGQPGGQCRVYESKHPASNFTAGRQCKAGKAGEVNCVEEERWCDQHCDCPHCNDRADCQHWFCPQPNFKCSQSGLCLDPVNVCDGVRDCGDSDGSDEHDCPCEESSSFWGFWKLIRDLGRECLINPDTASGIKSLHIDRVRSGGFSLVDVFQFLFSLQENC